MKIVTVLSAPLLLTATLLLMPAGDADAHRVGASWQSGYVQPHFAPRHRAYMPRWLAANYDFRRWFAINYYYDRHGLSWKRLYKRYTRDHRWHGYSKRKKRSYYYDYNDRRDKRRKNRKRRGY